MQNIFIFILLKQRTSRTTEIITAMPTVYVCVHVWHYYMYVCVLVCVYLNESVCICMCTNTCTASASGKPALAVTTLPLSFIQTYFLLCFFFFLLLSLTVILSPAHQLHSHLSQHINFHIPTLSPSHISLLATLFGFQCTIQWLAKVFTPLGIFPILLPYKLEL